VPTTAPSLLRAESRTVRVLGWAGPLLAAVVGTWLRLVRLGQPNAFVFDETYYAKDGLSLLRFGSEQQTVDDANERILATAPSVGEADVFLDSPAYVVHPPLGKWLIGVGELPLGVTPEGWRVAAVAASVLGILLLGRVVLRLTRNALLATIAAGLLALDGLHLVLGRTAILDGFLALLVLAAFAALLIDRDHTRARYLLHGVPLGWRWWRGWRVAAGVLLGLACGVKWSALWYVAAFGALTLAWEISNRRAAGAPHPWRGSLQRDALPAFVSIVVVAGLAYLLTWTGWLLTDSGWDRQWDEGGWWLVPQPLQALAHYHQSMYSFHVGLESEHPYESSAWGWLLQLRPTSFFYESTGTGCGASTCSTAVTSVGNPLIWWPAAAALVYQTYRAVFVRDWRSTAAVVGVAAGWVPWLFYPERTTFTFYSVVFLPFLVIALTLSLGQLLGRSGARGRPWRIGLVGGYLLAVVVAAWWFYPVWTAMEIPYEHWRWRMWLPSWI